MRPAEQYPCCATIRKPVSNRERTLGPMPQGRDKPSDFREMIAAIVREEITRLLGSLRRA